MAWVEQDVETLKDLWTKGVTASDIARRLLGGQTRAAVIGKAHRMGLSSRANPTDHNEHFERVATRVIEAPLHCPVSIERAAADLGMNAALARRMWNERIEATHGGDPL